MTDEPRCHCKYRDGGLRDNLGTSCPIHDKADEPKSECEFDPDHLYHTHEPSAEALNFVHDYEFPDEFRDIADLAKLCDAFRAASALKPDASDLERAKSLQNKLPGGAYWKDFDLYEVRDALAEARRDAVVRRLIAESNERRDDDAVRDDEIAEAHAAGAASERERCAKIAEDTDHEWNTAGWSSACTEIANRIRNKS